MMGPSHRPAMLPTLHRVFGHTAFRPGQQRAIEAFAAGRDVVLVLPTGGGKSACYQVPALHRPGPTLVVSPLIALMQDQVRQLGDRGVHAVALHSGLSWDDLKAARDEARRAALVYASPERVKTKRFRALLHSIGVAAVAIDEAHCISEWGHDFRPDYLKLGALKAELGVPVMAVTATATPRVRDEIRTSLGLVDPEVIVGAFSRDNLALSVEHIRGDNARLVRLAELLDSAERAIVYGATRNRVRDVAAGLRKLKIKADHYHGGRTDRVRDRVFDAFVEGRTRVLVATSAFGMGVDLPDIRTVVHVQAPGSLAAYYQEAGRAGRDGHPARCTVLYSPSDALVHARLRGSTPTPGAEAGWQALADYLYGTTCREQAIVGYFSGEQAVGCGRCDACTDPTAVADRVEAARADLRKRRRARDTKREADAAVDLDAAQRAVVLAFVDALAKPLGRRLVAQGLRGSRAKPVVRKKLPDNPHFGALRGVPEVAIVAGIDDLLAAGELARKGKKYPTVWLPDKRVRGPVRTAKPRRPPDPPVVAALKSLRRSEARRRRIKAYQVLDDRTIRGIAEARPGSPEELLEVKGMGPARMRRYGAQILEICGVA